MTAYVQSISVALTPVVPVLSVIVTFLVHISLGYELSPAEVRKLIMQYETVQMMELITLPFFIPRLSPLWPWWLPEFALLWTELVKLWKPGTKPASFGPALRFVYTFIVPIFYFTQQHRHHFLLTKEGFRAGGNEIKSSKAAGSECGSSHLRGHFRLALCTAVQRDEKAETKTVKLVFIILPISRVICTTAVLIVIGKPRKPADLNPHLFRFSFHHLPFWLTSI